MIDAREQTAPDVYYVSARDETRLAYRWFAGDDNGYVLICLHGSFFDSTRYINLARLCSAHGISVCVPDWRGHGQSGGRFGDVRYRGQLEDDLCDLVEHLVNDGTQGIILGGHSAGSLVALRYLLHYGCRHVVGYYSIAPPLAAGSSGAVPTTFSARLVYMLRYLRSSPYSNEKSEGDPRFSPRFHPVRYSLSVTLPPCRRMRVLTFGKPDSDSGRTPGYTARLTGSFNLPGIPQAYGAIEVPCHLFAGDSDEAVSPDQLDVIRYWYIRPFIPIRLSALAGANHMTAVSAAAKPLALWARECIEQNESLSRVDEEGIEPDGC